MYTLPNVYNDFLQPARFKVAYGGRGSGKSWAFAIMLLLVASERRKWVLLCLREIQNSIQDSVYQLLVDLVGFDRDWKVTKTDITNLRTGTKIIFKGLYRNIQSIKSIEGVRVAWVEEAHSVSQESWDYLIPTIRAAGSQIWATFNPDQEDDPVYKMFVSGKRENAIVKKINYTDNPYFPDTLMEEMEYARKYNPEKWSWIWEGNCRKTTEAQIFKGCYEIGLFDIPENAEYNHGMDFGFADDPSTVIQSYISEDTLYITRESYRLHASIDVLPDMIREVVPGDGWNVIGDSSRPDTIYYIRRHGYRWVKSSKKGKGSIVDGIEKIKSFKRVVIHPSCKNTIEEFRLYAYKTNTHTGEILPTPEDKNNHIIDALRYSLEKYRGKRGTVSLATRI